MLKSVFTLRVLASFVITDWLQVAGHLNICTVGTRLAMLIVTPSGVRAFWR
jgi:hypothetical protein